MRGSVDLACLHDPVPQPGFIIVPLVQGGGVPGRQARRAGAAARNMCARRTWPALPLILPGRPNASRRLLDGWLSRRGIRLNVRLEADDHLVIRALVRDGIGFSLLTQGAFLSELRPASCKLGRSAREPIGISRWSPRGMSVEPSLWARWRRLFGRRCASRC